jgi:hypothetical protein
MTSVAGGFFLVTSLSLTFLSGAAASNEGRSVFDMLPRFEQRTAPPPAPVEPAQPEGDRLDPTESSAPQAAETQLASITTGPAETSAAEVEPLNAAPAPATATTRAGPLDARASQPQRTAAATPPAATPSRSNPQPPPATTQRSAGATNQAATGANQTPTRPLVIPNTTGAATGPAATAPTEPESVEAGAGVEAVRRERAGPDQ